MGDELCVCGSTCMRLKFFAVVQSQAAGLGRLEAFAVGPSMGHVHLGDQGKNHKEHRSHSHRGSPNRDVDACERHNVDRNGLQTARGGHEDCGDCEDYGDREGREGREDRGKPLVQEGPADLGILGVLGVLEDPEVRKICDCRCVHLRMDVKDQASSGRRGRGAVEVGPEVVLGNWL